MYYPEHPKGNTHNGYIAEHVLVMEKLLGRFLFDNEIVHHLDGNRSNNLPENLEVMTRGEHARLHHSGTAKIIELTCAFCGTVFEREYHQVVTKVKNRQVDFYCNRSCAAKSFGNGRSKLAPLTQLEE